MVWTVCSFDTHTSQALPHLRIWNMLINDFMKSMGMSGAPSVKSHLQHCLTSHGTPIAIRHRHLSRPNDRSHTDRKRNDSWPSTSLQSTWSTDLLSMKHCGSVVSTKLCSVCSEVCEVPQCHSLRTHERWVPPWLPLDAFRVPLPTEPHAVSTSALPVKVKS